MAKVNNPAMMKAINSFINGGDHGAIDNQIKSLLKQEALAIATKATLELSSCLDGAISGMVPQISGSLAAIPKAPKITSYSDNYIKCKSSVWIGGDLHRDSLCDKSEGVYNIAALFNNGYSASRHVTGLWHGVKTVSLMSRSPVFFVDSAINAFMSGHSGNYDVLSIKSMEPYY